MRPSSVPSVPRRLAVIVHAALVAALLAARPALAADPEEWLLDADRLQPSPGHYLPDPEPLPAPPPAPSPTRTPRSTSSPAPTPTPEETSGPAPVGYDVSYPQCGRELPDDFGFAIVGVTGGRVYDINPCLGPDGDEPSQLEWAGPSAELYFNTGNPGPRWSRYWPAGRDEPRECETRANPRPDTAECAFNYGWNAAEHAYRAAVEAYAELGWIEDADEELPETTIWLDVEVANSWRRDRALNVAALEGAVAFLEDRGIERIGFYSTPRLWQRITGGTDAFADHPAWHAGASGREDAERRCIEERAFTGGELAMVQWVEDDLDHNVRCEDVARDDE